MKKKISQKSDNFRDFSSFAHLRVSFSHFFQIHTSNRKLIALLKPDTATIYVYTEAFTRQLITHRRIGLVKERSIV